MNNVNENKTVPLMGTRMVASGVLAFIGALLYIPQSGIIRTLPLLAVLAALGDVFYKSKLYNCGCVFAFTFCLLSVNGMEIACSFIYSAFACVVSLGSIYGLRLLRASFKTKKKDVKRKCILRSIIVLFLVFAAYMIVCGNIISAVMFRNANNEYINENYQENIDIHYTVFDAVEREYKTYVSFTHNGMVVGDKDDCYISLKSDNVRDYYETFIMEEGKLKLHGALSTAVDMFEVKNCGIDFESGEVLQPETSFDSVADKSWYVVSLYHMVDDKEAFQKLYDDCTAALENLEFKTIIICAGNASEVLYTATVTKENAIMTVNPIEEFDEEYLKEYGVTEMTVLDYWRNR